MEEIRSRFDGDVERFSNLETGQSATIDAPLAMGLIAEAAIAATPEIRRVLDIGCGAGNNTIKLLDVHGGDFDCDLNDLSEPMLERAQQRVSEKTRGKVATIHEDFRTAELGENCYDVILAAAVLHHLRADRDWADVFEKVFTLLRPGGSFWITDLVSHENRAVQALMWRRYGDYLSAMGGKEYRDNVFAYVDHEDSPRSVIYQLDLLKRVGFDTVEILHKNSSFAAFGAVKSTC